MTNMEPWHQVREHLDKVLDLAPEDRSAYLDRCCAGQAGLRAEIEAYLADETDVKGFIEKPATQLLEGRSLPLRNGERLGPFVLEERIGAGGMGEVYRARRVDLFEQRVAVKILKPGLRTREIVRRFGEERRILGRLDHPRIARILDGGSTHDGLPFLVMEYVEGIPIDRYCDDHALKPSVILELYGKVCDTVQAAHQSLIVHCDLKPANILVTEDGEPKLLDFGIARALRRDGDRTVPTAFNERMGTRDYASPEQIQEGEPITTASDVYSLGALLHTLIAGSPPGAGSPSPGGDLGRIADKAMAHDPLRRYASVAALADDVRRFTRHEPVAAREPRTLYVLRLFVRRNRVAMLAGMSSVLLVVAFVLALSLQLRQTEEQRVRAEALQEDFLNTLALFAGSEGIMTAERFSSFLGNTGVTEMALEPSERARILNRVGRAYYHLGDLTEARLRLEEALELYRRTEKDNSQKLASTLNNLGLVLLEQGETDLGIALIEEALTHFSPEATARIDSLTNLAKGLEEKGNLSEAEAIYRRLLDAKRNRFPARSEEIARGLNNLAVVLLRQNKLDEAEALFLEALEIRRQNFPSDHPLIATTLLNYAVLLDARGHYRLAIERHHEALRIRQYRYADGHPILARSFSALAYSLLGSGAPDELAQAESLLRRAIATHRRERGDRHTETLIFERNLAAVLLAQHHAEEAETLTRDVLARAFEAWSPEHWRLADLRSLLGECLLEQGRRSKAERLLIESHPIIRDARGEGSRPEREARQRLEHLLQSD